MREFHPHPNPPPQGEGIIERPCRAGGQRDKTSLPALRNDCRAALRRDCPFGIVLLYRSIAPCPPPARAMGRRHRRREERMPVLDLDSGQFHYHIDDFSDPWLRGEPVLLHHAAGGNLHRWRAWVPTLARHRPVIRFDMRGHAGTPPPADMQFSLPDLAADIARVMDGSGPGAGASRRRIRGRYREPAIRPRLSRPAAQLDGGRVHAAAGPHGSEHGRRGVAAHPRGGGDAGLAPGRQRKTIRRWTRIER